MFIITKQRIIPLSELLGVIAMEDGSYQLKLRYTVCYINEEEFEEISRQINLLMAKGK